MLRNSEVLVKKPGNFGIVCQIWCRKKTSSAKTTVLRHHTSTKLNVLIFR